MRRESTGCLGLDALLLALAVGCAGGDEPQRPAADASPAATSMPTVPPEAVRSSGRFEPATFDEGGYSVKEVRTGWVHPSRNFYFPGEDAPSGRDLRHLLIHDNAVLVEYLAGPAGGRP